MVPVVATLAMALPLIMPISALANTATLAGPPGVCPTRVSEVIDKLAEAAVFEKSPKQYE